MGIDGVGSSVVIALAAVLWFLYLVPTWLKRQEYLATERNAVRLQQTMRILAESAEVPSVVRVEATARMVAAQQRALRKQQRGLATRHSNTSLSEPTANRRVSSPFLEETAVGGRLEESSRAARRLKRSRALASLVLVGALVAGGFGIQSLLASGSWALLVGSVVVATGSFTLLGQAAAVSRARRELRRAALGYRVAAPLHDQADFAAPRRQGWNPIPVPKPLYLSNSLPVADPTSSSRSAREFAVDEGLRSDRLEPVQPDHAALLRAAAAQAERALRAAQAEPEVTRLERPAAASADIPVAVPFAGPTNLFARMGVVDEAELAPADLDEILNRRRAVG